MKNVGSICSLPTVLVPYTGSSPDSDSRDVFVYLRPETNGVLVESTLLKIIESSSFYRQSIQLVYLANIPGQYIVKQGIVEDHYRYKMPYTKTGRGSFTPYMRSRFEEHFSVPFGASRIVGAFDALEILNLSSDELFELWVPESSVLQVNCQMIKKIGDIYVINSNIPALLHKNTNSTDIAVMIFRSKLSNDGFHHMIQDMIGALRHMGILGKATPFGRAFHYSRGPFEQLLDARGHLYDTDGYHLPLSEMQFCSFLRDRGILCEEVNKILDFPIMQFRSSSGAIVEACIFDFTADDSYAEAYDKLQAAVLQHIA